MLPDTDHFVKLGPSDLLCWENTIYGIVQEGGCIPQICESFIDTNNEGCLVLHRVFCLDDMFWLLGRVFHNLCSYPMFTLMLFPFRH